jgi:ankyrin repeat protein
MVTAKLIFLLLVVITCSGSMSLIDAASGGDTEKVKQLIAEGDEVNQVDADGCNPIHHAAKNVSVVQSISSVLHQISRLSYSYSYFDFLVPPKNKGNN